MKYKRIFILLSSLMGVTAVTGAVKHRQLVLQLINRDIQGRYRGTLGGLAWTVITPLMMLGVYAFVFSTVFPMRWPQSSAETPFHLVLILFTGLSIFGFFQEVVITAPGLVLGQVSYVKKIIFPLEILPWVALGSAGIRLLIALGMQLVVGALIGFPFHATVFLLPVVLMPLVLGLLGLQWLLSSLGVYLRDIREPITVMSSGLMFLSPIFFPMTAVPEHLRWLFYLNPITYFVETGREVLLWGEIPAPGPWMLALMFSIAMFSLGYWIFGKLRKGFSDVI